MLRRAVASKVGLVRWVLGALAAVALMPAQGRAQVQVVFTVGTGGNQPNIQAAVNACPSAGCRIQLSDTAYELTREIWIENKFGLVLEAAPNLQLAGIRPRIYVKAGVNLAQLPGTSVKPADLERPTGWKTWPKTCTDQPGGSKNTSNQYSTSGFQHNGLIMVYKSTNVRIEGLRIDGTRASYFVNRGIWACMYDVLFGNVGVNLFQSKNVVVRNNEIKNFFSGIYMQNRNVGGAFAAPNPDDLDVADIIPYSQFGRVGDHLIEKNLIHHNWWGFYNEMEWDIGSTIRYNILDSNFNTRFTQSTDSSSEANNMAGGFMYVKDVMIVPHKIYNNTMNGGVIVLGHGGFKAGIQHYFYNNLITGWYRGNPKLEAMLKDWRQILSIYKDFLYNNTFEVGKADSLYQIQKFSSGEVSDAAACAAAGQANQTKCWLTWDAPVNVHTGIKNQWLWNGWEVKQGASYQGSYSGTTYPVVNNQAIDFFGVGGVISKARGVGAAAADISSQANFWAAKIPFKSMVIGAPGYLEPDWTAAIVDSTVLDKGWVAAGNRDQDGTLPDRGAIPKSKGALISPLTLKDQSIVTLNTTTRTVSFEYCLDGAGAWSNLALEKVDYYNNIARGTNTAWEPKPAWPTPAVLRPTSPAPIVNSCNKFEASIPTLPVDSFARFELIVKGDLNGQTVRSNIGVWIWRKTQYILDVYFTKPGSPTDTVKSIRVGEPVDMHVRALRTDNGTVVPSIDVLAATPNYPTYLVAGDKQIIPGDTIGKAVTALTNTFPVYFTTTGTNTMVMAGKIGTLPVPGSGSIIVRPGLPERVQWTDPASYAYVDRSLSMDSMAKVIPQAPTPVTLKVMDKFGNAVDTVADVIVTTQKIDGLITSLDMAPTLTGPFAGGPSGPWAFKSDVTGIVNAGILVSGVAGQKFWGFASVVGKPPVDSVLLKVGKPMERLMFVPVTPIDTFITIKRPVTIILTQDGVNVMSASGFAGATVRLSSVLGTSFYTSATDVVPTDSVVLVAGKATVWVTSAGPLTNDTLKASNFLLGNGLPALYAPVSWKPVPAPPAPPPVAASFSDFDCDGFADSIDVELKEKLTPAIRIDSLRVAYGTTDVWLKSGWRLYPDSIHLRLALPVASTVRGNLTGTGVQLGYTVARPPVADTSYTTDTLKLIADKVMPALMDTAYLVENFARGTQPDTLKVRFTEPVNFNETDWAFAVVNAAGTPVATTTLAQVSAKVSPADARNWIIVFNGNTAGTLVASGYRLRLLPTAGVTDLSRNTPAGAECSPGVPVVEVPSPVPVNGAWLVSAAGNGRADRLYVKLAKPVSRSLRPADLPVSVRLTWGGGSDTAWAFQANFLQTADSTVWEAPVGPMAFGVTRGFNVDGTGSLQILGNGRNELVAVQDSVSPIPVRAVMGFGALADTVTVTYSEPMSLAAVNGEYMLWKKDNGADQGLAVSALPSSTDLTRWSFPMVSGAATNPAPGDSTRLPLAGSKMVAANGTQPSTTVLSPYVMIVGGDRPPSFAWYKDTDADGLIDYVGMRFSQPIKTSPSFLFRFGSEEKAINAATGLVFSPSGFTAEVRFATPFVSVSTFVDSSAKLGTMISGMEDVVLSTPFAIVDSVDPVILSAKLSYASYYSPDENRDTLRLKFSEPVILTGTKENLVWVPSPVRNPHTYNHLPGTIQVGPDEVWMFADTSSVLDQLGSDDSIRIAPRDLGGELTDVRGNAPLGSLAKWTAIQAGQRPPRFEMAIYPSSVMKIDETVPDIAGFGNGPQMTVWVSNRRDSAMFQIDELGNPVGSNPVYPGMLPGKAFGPKFSLNGPFQASALIYDNMGVFVGSTNLLLDSTAILANGYAGKDGNFEVTILWNGENAKGEKVASGIYMFRVVVYRDLIDEATQQKIRTLALNLVTKVGINIPLKK